MKIAITGGSGSVGRAVVDMALGQGYQVVSIDLAPPFKEAEADLSFAQIDLTDFDAFVRTIRGCDAMIHLAAIAAPGGRPDHVVHNNNVTSSYNALRAAVEVGIRRVCQASSVNAGGLAYSRWPHFDYFPLDEKHPSYNEDPYSLSKWVCEEQGNSFARRYEDMTIASMRFHWVVKDRPVAAQNKGYSQTDFAAKNLWGYVTRNASARACLFALTADFKGHEVFYLTAPDTIAEVPSLELKQQFFPDVPVRGDLSGNKSFFDCSKAERLLGWQHDQ